MLYFAYGSNMEWERIQERCPSAKFVCRALLQNYRLTFPRYSKNNGCWTAGVERAKKHEVWGVVYAIDDHDVGTLNQSEGYRPDRIDDKNAHLPFQCHVFDEGDEDKPLSVIAFVVNLEGDPPPHHKDRKAPNERYKGRIVDGAKHWRLPSKYIQELEAIEVVE